MTGQVQPALIAALLPGFGLSDFILLVAWVRIVRRHGLGSVAPIDPDAPSRLTIRVLPYRASIALDRCSNLIWPYYLFLMYFSAAIDLLMSSLQYGSFRDSHALRIPTLNATSIVAYTENGIVVIILCR